jgi:hypothetical protein
MNFSPVHMKNITLEADPCFHTLNDFEDEDDSLPTVQTLACTRTESESETFGSFDRVRCVIVEESPAARVSIPTPAAPDLGFERLGWKAIIERGCSMSLTSAPSALRRIMRFDAKV